MLSIEKTIKLPKILVDRRNLSLGKEGLIILFLQITYWSYNVASVEMRGHAFEKNRKFIIARSCSFDVVSINGRDEKTLLLIGRLIHFFISSHLQVAFRRFGIKKAFSQ